MKYLRYCTEEICNGNTSSSSTQYIIFSSMYHEEILVSANQFVSLNPHSTAYSVSHDVTQKLLLNVYIKILANEAKRKSFFKS